MVSRREDACHEPEELRDDEDPEQIQRGPVSRVHNAGELELTVAMIVKRGSGVLHPRDQSFNSGTLCKYFLKIDVSCASNARPERTHRSREQRCTSLYCCT